MAGSILLTGCTTTIATKPYSRERVVADAPIAATEAQVSEVQTQTSVAVVQAPVVAQPVKVCPKKMPQPQCKELVPCPKCGQVHPRRKAAQHTQPILLYQVQPAPIQSGGRVHYERTNYFH